MNTISQNIKSLVNYGLEKGLLSKEDKIYTQNRLLEIMKEDSLEDCSTAESKELETILKELCDIAKFK